MRPYFSIIIPLYNKELYIKNTLNSVLNQTFQDFEIIVINDGSTDNSLEIAQKTLSNFNNATFINQKNKGLSIARNKGIANSKGLIIALLDADDIWNQKYLETIYQLAKNHPEAALFGTDFLEFYSPQNIVLSPKKIASNLKNKLFIIDSFFITSTGKNIIAPSSFCFRKKITSSILFDGSITYGEDIDFYIKANLKHTFAYAYNPLVTILCDVPNQMTKIGLSGKNLPDLDFYELRNSENLSLIKYLDFIRYTYANQYRESKNKLKTNELISKINFKNLTFQQKILLKSPYWIFILIKKIKKILFNNKLNITSY
jgi:glycosyltransferase involved in cell wall biosynthesis